jgi:predicted GNAT superfamily acetyltransferase
MPTDRCTAEWWVGSPRVRAVVSGEPCDIPPVAERIHVPASIGELRRTDSAQARRIQAEVSDRFESAFDRGLAVVGLDRSPEGGTYLLSEFHED